MIIKLETIKFGNNTKFNCDFCDDHTKALIARAVLNAKREIYLPDKWSSKKINLKMKKRIIDDFLCENTRFYYLDDKYHDDVGVTPSTTFDYFGSECKGISWPDNGDIIVNYMLGIGGRKIIGYRWTDEFTKHNKTDKTNELGDTNNWKWKPE